jgi:hypothetical protein
MARLSDKFQQLQQQDILMLQEDLLFLMTLRELQVKAEKMEANLVSWFKR